MVNKILKSQIWHYYAGELAGYYRYDEKLWASNFFKGWFSVFDGPNFSLGGLSRSMLDQIVK